MALVVHKVNRDDPRFALCGHRFASSAPPPGHYPELPKCRRCWDIHDDLCRFTARALGTLPEPAAA